MGQVPQHSPHSSPSQIPSEAIFDACRGSLDRSLLAGLPRETTAGSVVSDVCLTTTRVIRALLSVWVRAVCLRQCMQRALAAAIS